MKKKIVVIGLFLILSNLFPYSYSKKCKLCMNDHINHPDRRVDIGIANRNFAKAIIYKDGKAYAWYNCQYGHSYLVDLSY